MSSSAAIKNSVLFFVMILLVHALLCKLKTKTDRGSKAATLNERNVNVVRGNVGNVKCAPKVSNELLDYVFGHDNAQMSNLESNNMSVNTKNANVSGMSDMSSMSGMSDMPGMSGMSWSDAEISHYPSESSMNPSIVGFEGPGC